MDQTLSYLKDLNVPKDLQRRVRTWFTYNWEHQKTLSELEPSVQRLLPDQVVPY